MVNTKAQQWAWYFPLLLHLFLLLACSSPGQRIDALANQSGMTKQVREGLNFRHVIYARPVPNSPNLHIYLDGDGSPWLHGRYIARDPTPKDPLALRLAARDDQADSVYLGRPCYIGLFKEPLCEGSLWTSARYSDAVVRSMAAAAQALIEERAAKSVTLIGYSGGGSMAMLMLEYMVSVDAVVTVAANLDVESWSAYHGYLPLTGSRNPCEATYSKAIQFRHFAGEKDSNVPLQQTMDFVAKHGGELVVLPGFAHRCCWQDQWPALLK